MQKNVLKKLIIFLLFLFTIFSFNKVYASSYTNIKTIDNSSSYNKLLVDDYEDIEIVDADPVIDCSKVSAFKFIWNFIIYLAPFLVIIFGSVDYFKVVTSGSPDDIKKAKGNFKIRIIAFIILLVLPYLVRLIVSFGSNGSNSIELLKCIVK